LMMCLPPKAYVSTSCISLKERKKTHSADTYYLEDNN